MSRIEVGEVWGVGGRIARRLEVMGIHTVLDLRNASPKEMRRHFGVVMERTCNELRGISCLALDDIAQPKQQIMSSRSFGRPVETIEELRESLASYLSRAAEKLRKQQSVSAAVYVFIQTNRFNKDEQYNAGLTVPMPEPTDDTLTLTAGYAYQWHAGRYDPFLLGTDVTALFITTTVEAIVTIRVLYDSTP
jgi:DNA polymerase V